MILVGQLLGTIPALQTQTKVGSLHGAIEGVTDLNRQSMDDNPSVATEIKYISIFLSRRTTFPENRENR